MSKNNHTIKVEDSIWKEMSIMAAKEELSGPNQLLVTLFLDKLKQKNPIAWSREMQQITAQKDERAPQSSSQSE